MKMDLGGVIMMHQLLIAFRLDDICSQTNWDKFNEFKKVFDKYDIKPLIGVVPCNKDENLIKGKEMYNFWGYIKELESNGWSVSQHGYTHVYSTKKGGILGINNKSEFAGLPYNVQLQKLKTGKTILENNGIKTDIFMAPSHSYDKNTINALKETGFKFVTDGYTKYLFKYNDITFIPCRHTVNYKGRLIGSVTICIHTNTSSKEDVNKLEKIIAEHRENICDFNELIKMNEKARNIRFIRIIEGKNTLIPRIKKLVKTVLRT